MFDRLGRARFFSKLELKYGFHQIPVAPDDIEKTAINTKYGHSEFFIMRRYLRHSPATFQSLMNKIFNNPIDECCVLCPEDTLIYSNLHEEHLRQLCTVLERLRQHGLYVRMGKLEILTTETEFIRSMVGRDVINFGRKWKKLGTRMT